MAHTINAHPNHKWVGQKSAARQETQDNHGNYLKYTGAEPGFPGWGVESQT